MSSNIAKNTLYLTIAYIGQKILAFTYFIVLARVMMPENTGVYFLALSITTIFSVIADFGISPVVIRDVAKKPEDAKKLVRSALGAKIPLLVLAVISAISAAWLLGYELIIIQLVMLAALVMAADSLSLLFYGVLRGFQKLKYESLGIFIGQIIAVTLGGLSLWLSPNLFYLVGALAAGSVFNAILSSTLVSKKIGRDVLIPDYNKAALKKLMKIALPFALAGIFVKLYSYVDTVLISKFIGNEGVGIYSIAYKYTYAFQFIPLAFIAALYPGLSSLLVGDTSKLKRVFEESMWYMMLLATPIVFGLWSLAPEVVGLAGGSYAESAFVLQVLVFVLIPIFLDFPIGSLLNAADRQITKTTLMGIAMVINVASNAILIPIYGVVGAAYAALASFCFLFIAGLYFVPKIVKGYQISQLVRMMLPIGLSGLIMGISVYYMKETLGFILAIPFGALIYLSGLLLTRSVRKEHYQQMMSLLKR